MNRYEAIYEDGVLKPVQPLNISEGQHVRLEIDDPSEEDPDDLLELAAMVYDGLTGDEIDDIERIATERRDFLNLEFSIPGEVYGRNIY